MITSRVGSGPCSLAESRAVPSRATPSWRPPHPPPEPRLGRRRALPRGGGRLRRRPGARAPGVRGRHDRGDAARAAVRARHGGPRRRAGRGGPAGAAEPAVARRPHRAAAGRGRLLGGGDLLLPRPAGPRPGHRGDHRLLLPGRRRARRRGPRLGAALGPRRPRGRRGDGGRRAGVGDRRGPARHRRRHPLRARIGGRLRRLPAGVVAPGGPRGPRPHPRDGHVRGRLRLDHRARRSRASSAGASRPTSRPAACSSRPASRCWRPPSRSPSRSPASPA